MFHRLPIFSHPPEQAHRRGPLRIASAERRVKPLARLLRRATALRVTAPPRLRLRWLVWPKAGFRLRPKYDNILYHSLRRSRVGGHLFPLRVLLSRLFLALFPHVPPFL